MEQLKRTKEKMLKIRIQRVYLGSIEQDFVESFKKKCGIRNLTNWVKVMAAVRHGFLLDSVENVEAFVEYLEEYRYSNGVEWIKECMRQEMFPEFLAKAQKNANNALNQKKA